MANLTQPFSGINSIFAYAETTGPSDSATFPKSILRANVTGTYKVIMPTDQSAVNVTNTWVAGAVGEWCNYPAVMVLQTGSSVTSTTAIVAHRNKRLGDGD